MKWDLLLPVALVAALALMGIYAVTGPNQGDIAAKAQPALCTAGDALPVIVGLEEASGLALSRRDGKLMWSHNDSGEPMIYGVSFDGQLRGRLRVAGAEGGDWEAIATAPCADGSCLYVADIGDNEMARGTIVIYRTPEPAASQTTTAAVDRFEGVYPEGPQDAEAIFVINGSVYIITKGDNRPIRLYRFPTLEPGGPMTLELVASLTDDAVERSDRITDAAVSPDQAWIAMRTNDRLFFYKTAALLAAEPGTPLAYSLRGLKEPQGEGVAWVDAKTIYLAGESARGGTFGQVSCNLPS